MKTILLVKAFEFSPIFAQATGKVDADTKERTRREPARRYEDRAIELLRKALEATPSAQRGAYWWEQVIRDAAFDPGTGSRPNGTWRVASA